MVDEKGQNHAAPEAGGMLAQAPAARNGDKSKLHKIINDHLSHDNEGPITALMLRSILMEIVDAI